MIACLIGCFAVAAQAQAAEPLEVIKKAVKANGGKEKLAKYDAMVAKGKGVVNTQGMELKYEATWKFHYPNRMRVEIEANAMGQTIAFVQVFDGAKGWQNIAGMGTVEMNKDQLTALKKQMQADTVGRLFPLLDTKKYKISSVGESDVNGKKAIGLNVTNKDGLDINLYFDKQSYMLLKQEYQTKNETGQDVLQAVLFHGYKKVKGIPVPMKLEILQDGKKFVTAEFTQVELKEKLDASEFAKP